MGKVRWNHTNRQSQTPHMPETKTDTQSTIPLSANAIETLKNL